MMQTLAQFIKQQALELGFLDCGITSAEELNEKEQHQFKNWIRSGYQAEMTYLENNLEKRLNPSKLVEGAKSVIVLLSNYFPEKNFFKLSQPNIAKYSYGKDYHKVIKKKLKLLVKEINAHLNEHKFSTMEGRFFVDSAPVAERQLARRAGLGWIGKNSLLLQKKTGSFFFISTIICNLELPTDSPFETNHCGTCTACIDACPTQAIVQNEVIDSNLCISYQTIEKKGTIDSTIGSNLGTWIFGCDICQDVCPWNSFSKVHQESDFLPLMDYSKLSFEAWQNMTEIDFENNFRGSAIQRAGLNKIKETLQHIKTYSKTDS